MSAMLEEIQEQPEALEGTFRAERKPMGRLRSLAKQRHFRLILLVARGTSDNAARLGRYLLELTTRTPVSLVAPSLYTLYHEKIDLRDTLLVGLSQSGESPDVNMVLESARKRGAFTIGITNEPDSPMTRLPHEVFFIGGGKQRSVAATKTYTGQLLILYMMASALGSGVSMKAVSRIPDLVAEALKVKAKVKYLAEHYRKINRMVVLARGFNYGNAYELALKLEETCYVVGKGFSTADFLHGPIAVVEKDFPVILFAPPGRAFQEMSKMASRLNKYGALTLAITGPGHRMPRRTHTIHLPTSVDELYSPIPYIVPGQLFAAYLAEAKGLDPDHPRALKLVTRTI